MLWTLLVPATLLVAAVQTQPARAADYPVLKAYGDLAQLLMDQTGAVTTAEEAQGVQLGTQSLVKLGVEIMNLYASKNPNCKTQFEQMIAEIPEFDTMTLEQLHARYHDGKGLPTAPRHCYFGRSQVVHPALNITRLNSPWTDRVRQDVVADFDEVIEHLKPIQRNLDNPPN